MNWLIILIIVALLVAGAFIEVIRDFYELIWEYISEALVYAISFEWLSDVWELMGSAFEGLSEFSVYGLAFGIATAGFTFLLRKQILQSFTQYMSPTSKVFWTIATYAGCFIGGYVLGKGFENAA